MVLPAKGTISQEDFMTELKLKEFFYYGLPQIGVAL